MAALEVLFVLVVALVLGIVAIRVLGVVAKVSLYIVIGLVVLFLLWSITQL